ncbi:MAG: hypothetical protein ACR2K9_07970 [Solirubrobacteraceae bacterium]
MTEHSLSRTLVKSPPELWAEVSDPAALADHLGEFGEIKITRVEQESTVAWESDRANGTVELEPTKWGTRVKLTAHTEASGEPPAAAVAATEPEPPAEHTAPAASSGRFVRLFRRRSASAPAPVTRPRDEIKPAGDSPADPGTVAVLFAMLDTLGSAKHRPFSRG